MALVRTQTILTERPPPVGDICWYKEIINTKKSYCAIRCLNLMRSLCTASDLHVNCVNRKRDTDTPCGTKCTAGHIITTVLWRPKDCLVPSNVVSDSRIFQSESVHKRQCADSCRSHISTPAYPKICTSVNRRKNFFEWKRHDVFINIM